MRYAAMAYRDFDERLMYWEFLADTDKEAECLYNDISYDFIDMHHGYTALYKNPEYHKCMEDFMDCKNREKEEQMMLFNMDNPVCYLPVYAVKDKRPVNGQEVVAICDDGYYTRDTYFDTCDGEKWMYAEHEVLYWIPEAENLEGVKSGAWCQEIEDSFEEDRE